MCMRAMISLHLNASLKSYPLLQTLMIEHATYLCARSSHEAIHYASALVSVAASAASCFFVIGNRSKKSLSENPTELGGARRLWAPTCKHWMVSAATPAFPYLSLATSFDDSTRMSSVRSIFTACYPLHFCSGFCCCFCCFVFFHRRQEQKVSSQESHGTGRSPKSVRADVQTSDGERRDS